MSLQIKGKLTQKLAKEEGTSKAGKEWVKQSFVIDTGDQYNPLIALGLFGEEKVKLLEELSIGQELEVFFNLSSREHQGKWYTQADCWKITSLSNQETAEKAQEASNE